RPPSTTTQLDPPSLHDALPISRPVTLHHLDIHSHGLRNDEDVGEDDGGIDVEPFDGLQRDFGGQLRCPTDLEKGLLRTQRPVFGDRKSTRLNSSHVKISYAVFC